MAASNKSGPLSPYSGGMTSLQHFELRNAYRGWSEESQWQAHVYYSGYDTWSTCDEATLWL